MTQCEATASKYKGTDVSPAVNNLIKLQAAKLLCIVQDPDTMQLVLFLKCRLEQCQQIFDLLP